LGDIMEDRTCINCKYHFRSPYPMLRVLCQKHKRYVFPNESCEEWELREKKE
jgi:hypothetical protein